VYSTSMEGENVINTWQTLGFEQVVIISTKDAVANWAISLIVSNGSYRFPPNADILNFTTCAENGKIQLTPKITNHLFACYLNSMCKSNTVCLIQQWSVIFLLASDVQ